MVNFNTFLFFNRQMELITKPKEGSMKGNWFHVSLLFILFICIVIDNYVTTTALYLEYVTWKFIASPGMLECLLYTRSSLPSYGWKQIDCTQEAGLVLNKNNPRLISHHSSTVYNGFLCCLHFCLKKQNCRFTIETVIGYIKQKHTLEKPLILEWS